MLTIEADPRAAGDAPDEGYEAMGWTVRLNGQPIGRAWKSRLMDSYTMQINGLSITEQSLTGALDRARRYLGLDAEGQWPLPGWERATDERLPAVGEYVLVYRSHDDHPGWVIAQVHSAAPGAVDVTYNGTVVGGGRFQPSQIARPTGPIERLP